MITSKNDESDGDEFFNAFPNGTHTDEVRTVDIWYKKSSHLIEKKIQKKSNENTKIGSRFNVHENLSTERSEADRYSKVTSGSASLI